MPRRGGGGGGGGNEIIGPILIAIIVLAAIGLAVYPLYPKVTATFQIKQYPNGVNFQSAKLDHLTFAAASSIQKDVIFIYAIAPDSTNYPTTTVVQISYGGQVLVKSPLYVLTSGLWSLSYVRNLGSEQPNVYYHIQLNVTYPNGVLVSQSADVPPS